jgi:flagellar biosynthesis regulator FlaF
LVAFAVGLLFQKLAESKEKEIADLKPRVAQIQAKQEQFDRAYKRLGATKKEADQVAAWMEARYYWGDVLAELRRALIRSEDVIKKKLSAQRPGVEAGIWIEQMTTMANLQNPAAGGGPGTARSPRPPQNGMSPDAASDQTRTVTLICRAVNLSSVDSAANTDIAYAVLKAFQEDPLFDPKMTQLRGDITPDDANGTFTFGITVGLQNPLNL